MAGGMTRIPGLVERLQKELKALLPPSLNVKVKIFSFSEKIRAINFRFLFKFN